MATVWARISPHNALTQDDTISFITNLCKSCQGNISAEDIAAVYDVRAWTAAQFHVASGSSLPAAFTIGQPVWIRYSFLPAIVSTSSTAARMCYVRPLHLARRLLLPLPPGPCPW